MNNTNSSTFARNAKNTLYQTSNNQYGTAWIQDGVRPEHVDIKKAVIPTYSEIVQSMNDFKKSERLIKSKLIQQKLESQGVNPYSQNEKYMKKTQFHVKSGQSYKYPEHGLNVGPSIYRTNNMNYGSKTPAQFELQNKYYPSNNTFTKTFCGGNYKFNGLNTVKTISNVHNQLNDF